MNLIESNILQWIFKMNDTVQRLFYKTEIQWIANEKDTKKIIAISCYMYDSS